MLFRSPAWDEITYWAIDLETGGLDAKRDPILAVGMVPIRGGVVQLGEAFESLVRPEDGATIRPDSVRAHQLVPRDVRGAPPLPVVLREVHARLRQGALLAHHAGIEVGFLRRAYATVDLVWPRPRVVDTAELLLALERRARFLDPDRVGGDPVLELQAARRQLGLPDYPPHRALHDALAAAELFLVLRRKLGLKRVRDLPRG
ncbi:3'-5' exonuclease [Anaeromyxobacter paludicola]|uniref:Exonuclease domain-containing protein n=1 Tax=Anaeromyxobacter paludicola TaxID=2918171 RepID=A0ABM7XF16_9BACT|nr:3'-5' exonuclease [Anaeromyxobacter paludicola]BDG10494.1 hypothetical protein AMPC_36070 [Anaeromyxobacter paludicola]